ncbi:MAG: hypothetical protein IJY15_12705, partial [Thermoguttaceae bacterium]|nr:hypothetical protein [Thermoguttaceae bacterium]
MKRINILKRPFYLGLALFSAFALTAATAPTFAQDAPAEPAEVAAPAENAETDATETVPAVDEVATEAAPVETAETDATETAPVVDEVATEETEEKEKSNFVTILLFVALLAISWGLAVFCAKRFRQQQFRNAYFIIAFCFLGALISTILGLKQGRVNLGVDLRGGSILVYSVSPVDAQQAGGINNEQMGDLKNALMKRINPSGVREISIQELGANTEIRITIPEADEAEVERLERVINATGQLKFRILANVGTKDAQETAVIQLAQAPENAAAWTVVLPKAEQANGIIKSATWLPVDPAQEDSV